MGNPVRYRILALLFDRPRSPGQLAVAVRKHLNTVSRHLTVLRNLDLVTFEGTFPRIQYRVKNPAVREFLKAAERCAPGHR